MPRITKWIEAEMFLFFGGVTIYRTYENDNPELSSEFFFSLEPDNRWSHSHIDIRNLPAFKTTNPPEEQTELKSVAVLIQAIGSGDIISPKAEVDTQ